MGTGRVGDAARRSQEWAWPPRQAASTTGAKRVLGRVLRTLVRMGAGVPAAACSRGRGPTDSGSSGLAPPGRHPRRRGRHRHRRRVVLRPPRPGYDRRGVPRHVDGERAAGHRTAVVSRDPGDDASGDDQRVRARRRRSRCLPTSTAPISSSPWTTSRRSREKRNAERFKDALKALAGDFRMVFTSVDATHLDLRIVGTSASGEEFDQTIPLVQEPAGRHERAEPHPSGHARRRAGDRRPAERLRRRRGRRAGQHHRGPRERLVHGGLRPGERRLGRGGRRRDAGRLRLRGRPAPHRRAGGRPLGAPGPPRAGTRRPVARARRAPRGAARRWSAATPDPSLDVFCITANTRQARASAPARLRAEANGVPHDGRPGRRGVASCPCPRASRSGPSGSRPTSASCTRP